MTDALEALTAECERVSEIALALSPEDFALPTRCSPWDVKALLAHMWRDMDRIEVYVLAPSPEAPDTDSVGYWRAYDPVGDAPEISACTYEVADAFASGAELAVSFDEHWRECVTAAREEDGARLVQTWGPAMSFAEYLRTRVLEIVVHGLDMARALGGEPWMTGGGAAVTEEILRGLLGAAPPPALGWDVLTFIEKGTGRLPLSVDERSTLGDAASLFPLLA